VLRHLTRSRLIGHMARAEGINPSRLQDWSNIARCCERHARHITAICPGNPGTRVILQQLTEAVSRSTGSKKASEARAWPIAQCMQVQAQKQRLCPTTLDAPLRACKDRRRRYSVFHATTSNHLTAATADRGAHNFPDPCHGAARATSMSNDNLVVEIYISVRCCRRGIFRSPPTSFSYSTLFLQQDFILLRYHILL
jgi:hypothetical protein